MVRTQTLHSTQAHTWELVDARGPPRALGDLRNLLGRGPLAPAASVESLNEGSNRIQFLIQWPHPDDAPEGGVSLEHLALDLVGPEAIVAGLFHEGRAEFRVAGPDGDRLLRFFEAVKTRLGDRFDIRLLRVGEMRPDWSPVPPCRRPIVRDEDRKLVAVALGAGYYDSPKRVGVRELGEALGWSKSVVARRLRDIERRALEVLLQAPADATVAGAGAPAANVPTGSMPAPGEPDAIGSMAGMAGEV